MTDRVKPGVQKPEMSRDDLVRAHFEVHRDLEWSKELEPKFREYNASPDAMRHYREAWIVFMEDRDWEYWRDDVTRRSSNEELKAEVAERVAEIKGLEMRQSARDQATTGGQTFHDIVNRAGDSERGTPEPTLTKGKQM
jgi:hypothetical protein